MVGKTAACRVSFPFDLIDITVPGCAPRKEIHPYSFSVLGRYPAAAVLFIDRSHYECRGIHPGGAVVGRWLREDEVVEGASVRRGIFGVG